MNCPSCNRNLASTLSVCFSCGTMLNDSVREELALKITPVIKTEKSEEVKFAPKLEPTAPPVFPKQPINLNPPPTAEILTKPTSQTLVGFQNKNATLPDWRLQLQNSVRKRLDEHKTESSEVQVVQPAAPRRIAPMNNGATALKTEIVEEPQSVQATNPTIANALRRIEESRKKYLVSDAPIESQPIEPQTTVKQFPRTLSNRSLEYLPKQDQSQFVPNPAKPNVVQFSTDTKVEKYDTAKLPPIPLPAKISSSFEKKPEPRKIEINWDELDNEPIHRTNGNKVAADVESEAVATAGETDEVEDYAPISLRFNAAIFDLLIGSFLSLILLSPFMLLNGRFFSTEGFFAFLATCSIVMFIYLTTTIGFLGRTFGMRLFALEIVDIEENDYPTLHQAAVSSSVYLLSLAFGGLGFLTMLLNTEKRAAHDLLSKTIIVKEY